ncbi:MAG: hypothetical protein RBT49_02665 [Bacteroidales bacterium]|jgi:hypothetical protein|nr:hypothetical protein [Bacteroidales bacterium]
MKTSSFMAIPLLFIMYLIIAVPCQSCDPDDDDCDSCNVVYKPNIYIYPTEKTQLEVKINFPMGGNIITSIPEYGQGWNIAVDTNGIIDNYYSYLFYESIQPDIWQVNYGWITKSDQLESFFRQNMSEYGFEGREIDDFIEYWIPRLDIYSFYSIYPQTERTINNVIKLDFSKQPDSMLRLFYVIKGHNQKPDNIIEPTIESFERNGFAVTEWGVILK